MAALDDEVLAVGTIDRRGVMWSSTDSGASWTLVERPGVPATSSISHIQAEGHVVVMSASTPSTSEEDGEGQTVLLRSDDGGQTWAEVASPPPPNRGEGFASPLFSGGGQFFALQSSFVESWSEPELCYADIKLCRQDTEVSLYASDDGDRWERIDLSSLDLDEFAEVDAVAAPDDGRVVLLTGAAEGTATWTWPAGTPLPAAAEPVDPTTEVRLLGEDKEPQRGVRYGAPLYIHCGMDWLYVGGESWERTDDGPDPETGAGEEPPAGWPVAQQTIFGFLTLVDDDTVEYSIGDGEVIATYAPTSEEPPGCE